MHQARRHAFTTLELLIVIAVIAILTGILFLGGRSILSGSKIRSTKVTLASLSGMLGELEAKKQLDKAPSVWLWAESGTGTPPEYYPNSTSGIDFWRIPFLDPGNPLRNPDAMDAPGLVTEDGGAARHASRAIVNTQLVMQKMLSLPLNRQALQQMSPELQFVPEYQIGQVRAPGADLVMHTTDDELSAPPTEPIYYLAGFRVAHNDGSAIHRYICKQSGAPSGGAPTSPQFELDQTPGTPLLLDAWDDPIIFVPGTGLRVRKIGNKSEFDPADNEQTVIVISPEGKTARDPATQLPYVTQTGRPFFASAGPDGDFATGDDNIYSFEP